MTSDSLKLTVYFGESDRVEGRLLSDVLIDLFEREQVQASILLRAAEGFGVKQRLHTDRVLTLSEDLPLVAVALDDRTRIEALLPQLQPLVTGGLITLERVRLVRGGLGPADPPDEPPEATKLTLYLGRNERVGSRPAYLVVVDHLRRSGLAGATVLLGVDGMTHRRRQRARFFSRNESVPMMVTSVGGGDVVDAALEGLGALLDDPIATLERVRVCKRDGRRLAEPRALPERDDRGLAIWQKLMVYASEHARHEGHSLHIQLVRRLREEGASGATTVRGIWGFSGDHPPHGDRLAQLRRRLPVITTVVDTPEQIRRWFEIVDDVTDEAGLVTSEAVPAHLAVGPGARVGGLRLSRIRS